MRHSILSLLLLGAMTAAAQKAKVYRYYDKDWKTVYSPEAATYCRTVEEVNGKYRIVDTWLATKQIYMDAIASAYDPELVRDGACTWYYANGIKKREGQYKGGYAEGVFKRYYENGAINAEVVYGGKETHYTQYWSADGTPLLKNGTGIVQKPVIIGLDDVVYMEIKDSLLVAAFSERPDRGDSICSGKNISAEYIGGISEFNRQLSMSLVYPKEARRIGIRGKVVLKFIINKEGLIEDLAVLSGIGAGCDEAALDAMRKLGKWKPAIYQGKPVKVAFTLPLEFKLDEGYEEDDAKGKKKRKG